MSDWSGTEIAIVGMAGRFPGAKTPGELWSNVEAGVESIRDLDDAELRAAGETEENIAAPEYVKRAAVFDGIEAFDPELFGFSPKEASILDPQHRHFLEVCWESLEDAALDPMRFDGRVGIFGGCGMGAYFAYNVLRRPDLVRDVGLFLLRHTGNDKDFLVTRVAYLLGLTGPAINVQTACSTSLVAVHLASQSLLGAECDAAIAGGVTLEIPHRRGYVARDGEILSPDGRCRAFDHRAAGTVFGSGAGAVVLRRLEDAVEDGDRIHAVIRASAINNDGARKVGYLAPSVEGQAEAMVEAHTIGEIPPETIGLVECHGTGTYMGDPIEVAALTQAFRQETKAVGFAKIGSIKTNIGHLDTAAGVAGLIKAVQALRHRRIPPSLNFERPNPALELETSPFRVADRAEDWPAGPTPRRAAVNSLGVGGTNAYIILEEAPAVAPAPPQAGPHLIALSASSRGALDANAERLGQWLSDDVDLADVSYTLLRGRRRLGHRRVVAAGSAAELARILEAKDTRRIYDHAPVEDPKVVFLLPGGGAQHPGMGKELAAWDPVFRAHMERADAHLRSVSPIRLLDALSGGPIEDMAVQLPGIFAVSYAAAQSWIERGVTPSALIGHSLGENTAAALAGVFSFEAGVELAYRRGALFDELNVGSMTSVPLAPNALEPRLGPDLDLSVVNAPELCLVSGPTEALEAFERQLAEDGIEARRVDVPVAAHSRFLEPILSRFREVVQGMSLSAPRIPIISNHTGKVLTAQEATSAEYWTQHLRHTVRFADGMQTLLQDPRNVFLEVGPGRTLSSLARQQGKARPVSVSSLPHPAEPTSEPIAFVTAMGRLWAAGVEIDLEQQMFGGRPRPIVDVPTYAFQHRPFWIEPAEQVEARTPGLSRKELSEWSEQEVWREEPRAEVLVAAPSTILFFEDESAILRGLADRLRGQGHDVIVVRLGDAYVRTGSREFIIAPERALEGMEALLDDLVSEGLAPDRVVHGWLVTDEETFRPGSSFLHRNLEVGFYGMLYLVRALADERVPKPVTVTALTTGMVQVADEALEHPEKAAVLGPVRVAPNEIDGLTCSAVDFQLPRRKLLDGILGPKPEPPWDALMSEILRPHDEEGQDTVALRNDRRYARARVGRALAERPTDRVRAGKTYLITGGLGGIGSSLAEHLVSAHGAKALILGRSAAPARSQWAEASGHPRAEALRRLARADESGDGIRYAQADVTDIEALKEAIQAARAELGPICGVFHAAGTTRDNLILAKSSTECEDVFAPKIFGTLVLERVLEGEALDFTVLFSSTSTWLAAPGQVDYVAANAFLDAYARSRSTPERPVFAVEWGIWNEVGLAARAVEGGEGSGSKQPVPAEHPLLADVVDEGGGAFTARLRLDARTDWLVDEHRTRAGIAVLPGTGYLELFLAAARAVDPASLVRIDNVVFARPLVVDEQQPAEVRVELQRGHDGFGLELRSRRRVDGVRGWELHATARAVLERPRSAPRVDLDAVRARCTQPATVAQGLLSDSEQETYLQLGGRWRNVRSAGFGTREAVAELRLAGGDDGCALHPALMDQATGLGLALRSSLLGRPDGLFVPVSYRSVRAFTPLQDAAWVWARIAEGAASEDEVTMDLSLVGPGGDVRAEVEGLTLQRVQEGFSGEEERPLRAGEWRAEPGQGAKSAAEEALVRSYRLGIRPEEGPEVLLRAIAEGGRNPVRVLSSIDVSQLMAATRSAAKAARTLSKGDTFERPKLDVDFVEPRDGIERTLVGFFEELLGVSPVGIKDDFFELGGHSLIAVRLFSKLRQAFGVDLPISTLFDAPSVERCAERVRAEGGGAAEQGQAAATPKRESRFTHLVPMHPGDSAEATPLFMVAGMFGNVLNLRHLAHQIGSERPIYGVQARGLYGEHEPHDDFVDMARDYLAEVRQVQPQGPYVLGGFSGGGITAWEMANQLVQRGEEVALLVLLDTPIPSRPTIGLRERMEIQLQNLERQGPRYIGDWVVRRWSWEVGRVKERLNPEVPVEEQGRFADRSIELAFRAALPKYQVPKLDVPVALFRPPLSPVYTTSTGAMIDGQREFLLPDNGWTPYARNLEVEEVPGDHDSMVLEPNVRVLANRIRRALAKAERRIAARPVVQ